MSMLLVDVGNFTDSFANRPRELLIPNRIHAAQPVAVGGHPQNIRISVDSEILQPQLC